MPKKGKLYVQLFGGLKVSQQLLCISSFGGFLSVFVSQHSLELLDSNGFLKNNFILKAETSNH